MYKEDGELFWEGSLDSFGRLKLNKGESGSCPFRYQGQYEDVETGLYYNRFRYYSPEEGLYISQDPFGLEGGDKFYSYVHDPNGWIDPFGLASKTYHKKDGGSEKDDFITEHAYNRHKYNEDATSSKSKTQYGQDVDVKKLREDTMLKGTETKNYDAAGNHYATKYSYDAGENISTNDTPTSQSRVFINHVDPSKSSQFPFYSNK